MKEVLNNLIGFINSLSMGDYFFFIGTFLLIVLFIYVIYLIKCSETESDTINSPDDFDLSAVSKKIEAEYKPEKIELTHYEEKQEEEAIISYKELVSSKDRLGINYDDEYEYEEPELYVRKINLTDEPEASEPKIAVKLMSYEKEEAFLEALKQLQSNLIR